MRLGLPGGRYSRYKGPGAGIKLKSAKDRKKISVAGTVSEGEVRRQAVAWREATGGLGAGG